MVAVDLVLPKIRPGVWQLVERAVVTVPETTMYEDDRAVSRQHDIRLPGQFPDMETEPEALAVQQAPHEDFRFRVPPPYAGHHPASGCGINHICHEIQANASGVSTMPTCSCPIRASTCGTMMRATSRMTGITTLFPNWR